MTGKVLSAIAEYVVKQYSRHEFIERLKTEIPNIGEELDEIGNLYDLFDTLERNGKDRIWTGILKNSFAPFYMGTFHYVIGNPPWISWDNLPKEYRDKIDEAWKEIFSDYSLVKSTISGTAFKQDLASLFVIKCIAKYLKDEGTFGFLIPFTLFKSQAASIFRRYLANNNQINSIHDLVSLKPFEGATNRTSLLILNKGKTKFPVKMKLWKKKKSRRIKFDSILQDVKRNTNRFNLIMEPISQSKIPEESWFILINGVQHALRKAIGVSHYKAHEGINTRRANGIFFLRILDEGDGEYLVENMSEEQRIIDENAVNNVRKWVEPSLVYPLLRGEDIKKWHTKASSHVLVPNDSITGKTYSQEEIKIKFPKSYEFLFAFKPDLEKRAHYGVSINGRFPFYNLFQVNKDSFSNCKVVWKEISGDISGKGDLIAAVVNRSEGSENKPLIVDHKVMMIAVDDKDEAYFIAGILNSSVSRLIVASYTIETSISTHLLDHIRIPKYRKDNKEHEKIARLAKDIEMESSDGLVKKLENKLDIDVSNMFSIERKELLVIKKLLDILI